MTELVDAVIGRPDDEAARRADRILAMAGLLGQIALAGFQGLAVRRPGRGARRPVRLRHARSPPPARSRVVAWACGRLVGDRPAPVARHAGAGLRRALHRPRARGRRARPRRSPPRRSRWRALARRNDDRLRRAGPPLGFAALSLVAHARHARAARRAARRARPPARRRRRAGGRRRRAVRGQPRAARRSRTRAAPARPAPRSRSSTWPASRSSRWPARRTPGRRC